MTFSIFCIIFGIIFRQYYKIKYIREIDGKARLSYRFSISNSEVVIYFGIIVLVISVIIRLFE